MTNGGRRTPAVVPTEDAVVVERLLDAGAVITGKTNLEDLALGLGEGSAFGASRNPAQPEVLDRRLVVGFGRGRWRPGWSTWPSAPTRVAVSGSRRPGAAWWA